MKSTYVAQLEADQSITSFFLVTEKELRVTRDGKSYLRLELSDRTGSIEANVWDNAEGATQAFERDDIVKVQARVGVYRGKNRLSVDRVRRAEPGEIELPDFFPHTKHDVEQLYSELVAQAREISNPHLQRLALAVVEDPAVVPKLKRAPAAKGMHHAYLGGLLEHMVSLCRLCRLVAGHYPEVDADLLLTGAILHDIGKIDELCYERAFGYTTEGSLLGHIVQELELVSKKMDAIEDFPAPLKTLVQHLLISHHGHYEFGSPRLPMFREAVLLHYLDDLDSKMAAIRASLESELGEDVWTAWNPALERRLLRVQDYLRGKE